MKIKMAPWTPMPIFVTFSMTFRAYALLMTILMTIAIAFIQPTIITLMIIMALYTITFGFNVFHYFTSFTYYSIYNM